MTQAAIYAGTFDPITLGHLDVMRRAAAVFGRLVVAVAVHPRKKLWFELEERVAMIRDAASDVSNIEVMPFDGLLVEFARRQRIHVLVRGLRAFSDFEYEFQMALSNRKLAPDVETMFLMTSDAYSYVSSSAVREVAELGGDISLLVPPGVRAALERKLEQRDIL
ncbi:MAG TPA: pantetheine-phosphate adenylyltransferase [Kiritimatiellia bacterium]|nr:pantetheine-phosphate adenylyltransferase [Kiritimatiellia bacterium]HMO99131.1 pantetheine-phosphate adenylyltransferase [Kiritimatiellia bacterium]HMP95691.1 pantetheine-phosphate adenylyltransferase [Kiritimatiellia bacterium]